MNWLTRLAARRKAKKQPPPAGVVRQSFVADVDWHRNEELRPDRLGPGPDDIDLKADPWRPRKSLGPL